MYWSLTHLAPISQNGQTQLKQFVGNLPTNCLSVFDYFAGLALKGLKFEPQISFQMSWIENHMKHEKT